MITFLYIFTGLLLMGVSVPLILRRVPPNPWYGFRTPKTLGDRTIWYQVNEFSGRRLLWAGIVTVIGATVLAFFPLPMAVKALGDVAVMLVSVLWATAVSLAYLKKL